ISWRDLERQHDFLHSACHRPFRHWFTCRVSNSDTQYTGAVFTFGKSRFADNTANKFWIRNDTVTQVSCGDDHTAFVTNSGRIFTFGANEWGQLGLGHTKSTNKPGSVKVLKHEGVVMVGCGRLHTIAYTRNDKLYGFGGGGEGQLGVTSSNGFDAPEEIKELSNFKVKMISCGTEHSAVLTTDGSLYMFGSGSEGQLGLGDTTETDIPRPLTFGIPVKQVSCGYYHTAIVTDEGKLYTFGENEFGKLGLNDDSDNSNTPQNVSLIKERVSRVSCGNSHTAAVTDNGDVYTWGDGSSGQLGHGPSILGLKIPQKIMKLSRRNCRDVECGESHTAVITDSGSLYMCGDGRHGKLCQGDESFSNLFHPAKVKRFKGFYVEQVSCGGCQTIVRARRKDKANGEVSSDSDGETDPLKMSSQMKKGTLAALSNEQGVDSVDLGASFDGSARGRRRQRETSPLPPLARTLPPLGLSKAGVLPSLNSTIPDGSSRKLDQRLIPNIKKELNEVQVNEEMITKEEVKTAEAAPRLNLLKNLDADPLESTHFSASKSVRELKPLLDAVNSNAETVNSGSRPETEGMDEVDSGVPPGKMKDNIKPVSKKASEINAAKTVPNKETVDSQLASTCKSNKPKKHDSGTDSNDDENEDGDGDDDNEDISDDDDDDDDEDENSVDVKAVRRPNPFAKLLQTTRPTPAPRSRTQAKKVLEEDEDEDEDNDDEDEDDDVDEEDEIGDGEDEDDSEPEEQPAKSSQSKDKAKTQRSSRTSNEDGDKEDATRTSEMTKKSTASSKKQITQHEEEDEEDEEEDDNENDDGQGDDRKTKIHSSNGFENKEIEKSPEAKKKGKRKTEAEEDEENDKEKTEDGEKDDGEEGTGRGQQSDEPKAWQFWKKKTPTSKVDKSSSSVSSEDKPANQNKSKTCSIL
ncbi:X-linked retinitis pigmentosa GTPase regulator-like, partial [Acanthaster planci]|uniref:X-linked retinitis pigmentosa GTPase regulator n=1 Tax=Acanthaster planci TaxID=133434 RepID=A0A8B7ZFQ1_ACAPL